MDFHNMKRRELQTLCKKHGIPANLSNVEMVNRLTQQFLQENKNPSSQEQPGLKGQVEDASGTELNFAVNRKVKKVRFSPEHEMIEFTRSPIGRRGRRELSSAEKVVEVEKNNGGMDSGDKMGNLGRFTRSRGSKLVEPVVEARSQKRGKDDAGIVSSEVCEGNLEIGRRITRSRGRESVVLGVNDEVGARKVYTDGSHIVAAFENVGCLEPEVNGNERGRATRSRTQKGEVNKEKASSEAADKCHSESSSVNVDGAGRVLRSRGQKHVQFINKNTRVEASLESNDRDASLNTENDRRRNLRSKGVKDEGKQQVVGVDLSVKENVEDMKVLENEEMIKDNATVQPQARRSRRQPNKLEDYEIYDDARKNQNGQKGGFRNKKRLLTVETSEEDVKIDSNIEAVQKCEEAPKIEEPVEVQQRKSNRGKPKVSVPDAVTGRSRRISAKHDISATLDESDKDVKVQGNNKDRKRGRDSVLGEQSAKEDDDAVVRPLRRSTRNDAQSEGAIVQDVNGKPDERKVPMRRSKKPHVMVASSQEGVVAVGGSFCIDAKTSATKGAENINIPSASTKGSVDGNETDGPEMEKSDVSVSRIGNLEKNIIEEKQEVSVSKLKHADEKFKNILMESNDEELVEEDVNTDKNEPARLVKTESSGCKNDEVPVDGLNVVGNIGYAATSSPADGFSILFQSDFPSEPATDRELVEKPYQDKPSYSEVTEDTNANYKENVVEQEEQSFDPTNDKAFHIAEGQRCHMKEKLISLTEVDKGDLKDQESSNISDAKIMPQDRKLHDYDDSTEDIAVWRSDESEDPALLGDHVHQEVGRRAEKIDEEGIYSTGKLFMEKEPTSRNDVLSGSGSRSDGTFDNVDVLQSSFVLIPESIHSGRVDAFHDEDIQGKEADTTSPGEESVKEQSYATGRGFGNLFRENSDDVLVGKDNQLQIIHARNTVSNEGQDITEYGLNDLFDSPTNVVPHGRLNETFLFGISKAGQAVSNWAFSGRREQGIGAETADEYETTGEVILPTSCKTSVTSSTGEVGSHVKKNDEAGLYSTGKSFMENEAASRNDVLSGSESRPVGTCDNVIDVLESSFVSKLESMDTGTVDACHDEDIQGNKTDTTSPGEENLKGQSNAYRGGIESHMMENSEDALEGNNDQLQIVQASDTVSNEEYGLHDLFQSSTNVVPHGRPDETSLFGTRSADGAVSNRSFSGKKEQRIDVEIGDECETTTEERVTLSTSCKVASGTSSAGEVGSHTEKIDEAGIYSTGKFFMEKEPTSRNVVVTGSESRTDGKCDNDVLGSSFVLRPESIDTGKVDACDDEEYQGNETNTTSPGEESLKEKSNANRRGTGSIMSDNSEDALVRNDDQLQIVQAGDTLSNEEYGLNDLFESSTNVVPHGRPDEISLFGTRITDGAVSNRSFSGKREQWIDVETGDECETTKEEKLTLSTSCKVASGTRSAGEVGSHTEKFYEAGIYSTGKLFMEKEATSRNDVSGSESGTDGTCDNVDVLRSCFVLKPGSIDTGKVDACDNEDIQGNETDSTSPGEESLKEQSNANRRGIESIMSDNSEDALVRKDDQLQIVQAGDTVSNDGQDTTEYGLNDLFGSPPNAVPRDQSDETSLFRIRQAGEAVSHWSFSGWREQEIDVEIGDDYEITREERVILPTSCKPSGTSSTGGTESMHDGPCEDVVDVLESSFVLKPESIDPGKVDGCHVEDIQGNETDTTCSEEESLEEQSNAKRGGIVSCMRENSERTPVGKDNQLQIVHAGHTVSNESQDPTEIGLNDFFESPTNLSDETSLFGIGKAGEAVRNWSFSGRREQGIDVEKGDEYEATTNERVVLPTPCKQAACSPHMKIDNGAKSLEKCVNVTESTIDNQSWSQDLIGENCSHHDNNMWLDASLKTDAGHIREALYEFDGHTLASLFDQNETPSPENKIEYAAKFSNDKSAVQEMDNQSLYGENVEDKEIDHENNTCTMFPMTADCRDRVLEGSDEAGKEPCMEEKVESTSKNTQDNVCLTEKVNVDETISLGSFFRDEDMQESSEKTEEIISLGSFFLDKEVAGHGILESEVTGRVSNNHDNLSDTAVMGNSGNKSRYENETINKLHGRNFNLGDVESGTSNVANENNRAQEFDHDFELYAETSRTLKDVSVDIIGLSSLQPKINADDLSGEKNDIDKGLSPMCLPMLFHEDNEVAEKKDVESSRDGNNSHVKASAEANESVRKSYQGLEEQEINNELAVERSGSGGYALSQELDLFSCGDEIQNMSTERKETLLMSQDVNMSPGAAYGSTVSKVEQHLLASVEEIESKVGESELHASKMDSECDHEKDVEKEIGETPSFTFTMEHLVMPDLQLEDKIVSVGSNYTAFEHMPVAGYGEMLKECDVADAIREYTDSESSSSFDSHNGPELGSSMPLNIVEKNASQFVDTLDEAQEFIHQRIANNEGRGGNPPNEIVIAERDGEIQSVTSAFLSNAEVQSPLAITQGVAANDSLALHMSNLKSDDIPGHRHLNSTTVKNIRTILIHGTPSKPAMAAGMKENALQAKTEQIGCLTRARPAKRRALQDLQWK